VAIVENGAVQELHIERTLERGLVGNVYLGKVARVLPGMQSAFIDIGLDRAAFLHVADLNPPPTARPARGARHAATPIERQIFEGQSLTVQVIKDPIGTKGARLSAQVSIAGRMLVFLPHDRHIGISQKIGSPKRASSCARACRCWWASSRRRLHPAHQCRGGHRRRTGRRHRLPAQDLGRHPRARAGHPPGTLLHQDLSLAERVLRDLTNDATHTIRIDSGLQFDRLKAFGETFMPAARPSWSCTVASGRSSTCSASRTRSCVRWRARWS
jgi:ribonuclease G